MDSEPNNHVPAIYVAKYNRFVDNILGRINKILRSNYDPVTVKLTNPNASSKSKNRVKGKGKNKSKKGGSKNGSKKSAPQSTESNVEKSGSDGNDHRDIEAMPSAVKSASTVDNRVGTTRIIESEPATTPMTVELTTENPTTTVAPRLNANSVASRAGSTGIGNKNANKNKTTKKKKKNKTTNKTKTSNGNNKTKAKKTKPRAKATLYGLATLQRSGDVSINMMSDHTTVKTKFSLGPLILKVEKEFGRASKKELRSATATTAEMFGKLSLRVLHGGAATLHSIRVLQPKQVRVESADDHDRTREFVWKRSSHIAHLVSEKLSSATRSMLRPPPVPVLAA